MNTFLPYPDFSQSAACLDPKRLNKQRLESYQILKSLLGLSEGWKDHPAVKMWIGCEKLLADYGLEICKEWKGRGYEDSIATRIQRLGIKKKTKKPWWMGGNIHVTHRANLLRKHPTHYSKFGWDEDPSTPYLWPSPVPPIDRAYDDVQRFLKSLACKFQRKYGGEIDERISQANELFLKAYSTYDPTMGAFTTHTWWVVWRGMQDLYRKECNRTKGKQHLSIWPENKSKWEIEQTHRFDIEEFVGGISEDARLVVQTALELPYVNAKGKAVMDKSKRRVLIDFLIEMGWAAERIAESFWELRDVLR